MARKYLDHVAGHGPQATEPNDSRSPEVAASHPLIWGIHSLPLRKVEAVAALLFVGMIWGLAYQRTVSLRWCVAGHMLANLFGLAALVLLNIHDPTTRPGSGG